MKRTFTFLAMIVLSKGQLTAQNWQYVGAPYVNQTGGSYTAMSYADLEVSSNGNVLMAYSDGVSSPMFKVAEYNGSTWAQLGTLGNNFGGTVAHIDLETHGSNYYFSYAVNVSGKYYVHVLQYNGTNWTQTGDSLLLSNSNYDLLVDNNGVPTLVGPVPNTTSGTNKNVAKYSGGSWNTVATIGNSGGTSLNENAAVFDSQNNLYCVIVGNYVFTGGTLSFYTVVHKITGAVDAIAGDTIFNGMSNYTNARLKVNSSDIPFLCAINSSQTRTHARKLTGNSWVLMGDTSVKAVQMTGFDIDPQDHVVFCGTTTTSPYLRRVYMYDATNTYMMDTLNTTYTVSAVPDLDIPAGTSDVYQMVQEIKPGGIPDMSVMKHASVAGVREIISIENLHAYPNPSNGVIFFDAIQMSENASGVEVINSMGQKINAAPEGNKLDLSRYPKGIYLLRAQSDNKVYQTKIIVE